MAAFVFTAAPRPNTAVATASPQALAEPILAGLRDQRDRLRQGVVHGTGHIILPYRENAVDGPITFTYAFDFDQGILRVERDEPAFAIFAERAGMDPRRVDESQAHLETLHHAYIQKEDRTIHFDTIVGKQGRGEIQIHRSDSSPRDKNIFDIRGVGLLFAASYQEQLPWSEVYDYYAKQPADEVVEEEGGVTRIRWTRWEGMHRDELWVDRRKGFSPVRLERRDKRISRKRAAGAPDGWPEPYERCEATWAEINGVWVPTSFRIEDQQQKDAAGRVKTFEHELHWELVNKTVPAELFEIDSLGAPKGALVTDHRGQEIVLTRVIGEPENVEVGTMYTKPSAGQPSRIVHRGYGRGTWLFVGANALVVLLIWLLYRVRGSHKVAG